jgi:uncharacterized protein (TIGR03435 family)
LTPVVSRSVIDRTALAGTFDLDLEFAADQPLPPGGNASIVASPSIFTAVQEQLGLKLEPTTGAVDVLVIESIERPTED